MIAGLLLVVLLVGELLFFVRTFASSPNAFLEELFAICGQGISSIGCLSKKAWDFILAYTFSFYLLLVISLFSFQDAREFQSKPAVDVGIYNKAADYYDRAGELVDGYRRLWSRRKRF